jgi:hypothetical protein
MVTIAAGLLPLAHGATKTWDLTATVPYAPTDATAAMQAAIGTASTWMTANPGGNAYLEFGAGTYEFVGNPANYACIDVSGINPPGGGHLTIEGRGETGSGATNLLFTQTVQAYNATECDSSHSATITDDIELGGLNFSNVTFTNFSLAQLITASDGSNTDVTQGVVQKVDNTNGDVTVDLSPGYPTPPVLWKWDPMHAGHYMRCYQIVNGVAQLINNLNWNTQQGFSSAKYIGNTVNPVDPYLWEFDGMGTNTPGEFKGKLVGIKMVHSAGGGFFKQMTGLTLDHLYWTGSAHVQLEDGKTTVSDNISITNCTIGYGNPIQGLAPCMSTESGWVQLHVTGSNIVSNGNTTNGVGDDCIAYFGVLGGTVNNNTIADDFARGINLDPSCPHINDGNNPEISTSGNKVTRCPTIPANLP